MIVANSNVASASTDNDVVWHDINWCKSNKVVRGYQMRIVKATKGGRWGKVKALQHLLTHSFSGKAIAVKKVIENRGKRTAGVDKEIWDTPELKSQAIINSPYAKLAK